jgi:predicted branched-subunit amino acid permease
VPSVVRIIAVCLPAVLAITVFGVLYGAAARPLLGPELTLATSVIVFSGALQFATVGLVAAGAAAPAVLLTAVILNLRHIVLGAVLRPRLGRSRVRRAMQSWFLVDETFGFAVAAGSDPALSGPERITATERTLVVTGICCYAAWIVGTAVGVVGGSLPALQGFAEAIFPVLFIGLAALAARSRSIAVRAVTAALITAVIVVTLPDARALAPVVAGVLAALPGDPGRPATETRP